MFADSEVWDYCLHSIQPLPNYFGLFRLRYIHAVGVWLFADDLQQQLFNFTRRQIVD